MIDILLSTYNGENFLPQQLDSILQQTISDWTLFIRDDGSTDNTIKVIEDYVRRDARIHLVDNGGKNIGVVKSFEMLLREYGNDDYVMFCDQDDIWCEQKIEWTLAAMKEQEQIYPNSPIIVHTDLYVVDENLKQIAASFWKFSNIQPSLLDNNIHYLGICNSVTGCTMMMNRAVAKIALPFPEQVFMHDAWLGIITLLNQGIVYPLNRPTMYYRQHHTNVVGAEEYHLKLFNWKEKFKLARRAYRSNQNYVFKNILDFLYWKTKYFFALHYKA